MLVALRHYSLAGSLALLALAACDRSQPVEPAAVEAASTGAAGPTVKAPSNTSASTASESRIDVSWQDNSTNETGFEVNRSTSGPSGTFTLPASTGANIASYRDTGLDPLTQYCYEVRALKAYDGKTSYSEFSTPACATTLAPPPLPTAPTGTDAKPASSTAVNVSWTDNSTTEDGFRVERSLDAGTTWTSAGTVGPNVTSSSDAGRASEQPVCYRVIAFNGGGDSPPSNSDCTTPPAAPTALTATGVDGPAIDLTWTDKSVVEDGSQVLRATDGVTFSAVAELPANSTSYHDVGVSSTTTYWYQVRAKKDGGSSDVSNVASARAGVLTPPAAPFFRWVDVIPWSIALSWGETSNNADGFKLERCQAVVCSNDDFTLIAVIATTAYPGYYSDGAVEPGTTYTYRVRAFNQAGESAPSSAVSATACFVGVAEDGEYYCM